MRAVRGRSLTLEEARANAEASQEKLKLFQGKVKDHKKKSEVTKVHRGWQQQAADLTTERRQAEKDLVAAYQAAGTSVGSLFTVAQREKSMSDAAVREEGEALFQRIFSIRAIVKKKKGGVAGVAGLSKAVTVQVQQEIDTLKSEILQTTKELDGMYNKVLGELEKEPEAATSSVAGSSTATVDIHALDDVALDAVSALQKAAAESPHGFDENDQMVLSMFLATMLNTIEEHVKRWELDLAAATDNMDGLSNVGTPRSGSFGRRPSSDAMSARKLSTSSSTAGTSVVTGAASLAPSMHIEDYLAHEDIFRLDTIAESMQQKTCAEVLQRLRVEFPSVPQAALREAFMARQRRKYTARKKRALYMQCKKKIEELAENMREVFYSRREVARLQSEFDAEDVEMKRQQEKTKAALDVMKENKKVRDEEAHRAEAERQAAADREAAAREAQLFAEYQKRVQALSRHRELKEAEAQRQRELDAEQKAIDDQRAQLQKEHNAARVQARELELQRKRDKEALDRLMREEEQEHLEEKLEKLRMRVQQELGVADVQRDKDRVVQPTASRLAEDGYVGLREQAGRGQGIRGFTTEHLMKDPRFRVQEALANAGLLATGYARQLMTTFGPAQRNAGAVAMNTTSAQNPFSKQ
eukprot:PhM_4_TR11047/c0_g1_i1/m.87622